MRIFFDTNVLISAFIKQGACFELLQLISAKDSPHHFLVGKAVLEEFERKLKKRFNFSPQNIQAAIDLLLEQEIIPIPKTSSPTPVRDPDDALILASALSAKADILVTGDQDLLTLGKVENLMIMTPRELSELLEKERA